MPTSMPAIRGISTACCLSLQCRDEEKKEEKKHVVLLLLLAWLVVTVERKFLLLCGRKGENEE